MKKKLVVLLTITFFITSVGIGGQDNTVFAAENSNILNQVGQVDEMEQTDQVDQIDQVGKFSDVPSTHWASETIAWGVENGVVTGYTDGTFKPSNNVTESEFMAMLIRVFRPEIAPAKKGLWADPYYEIAWKNGYPTTWEAKDKVVSRGYVAELVSATQGFNYKGENAIRYLLGEGLARGNDPNNITIKSYNGHGKLTRAEAVQFVKNVIENGKKELEKIERYKESDPSGLKHFESGNGKIGDVNIPGYMAYADITPFKEAREISLELIKSIKVKEDVVSFTIPKLPKGYNLWIAVKDHKNPTHTGNVLINIDSAKPGDKYDIKFSTELSKMSFAIDAKGMNGGANLDGARVFLRDLRLESNFSGW